jgi:hypothetical protein
MTSKNRIPQIIIAGIIIITIVFVYLWMSGIFPMGTTITEKTQVNITSAFVDQNFSMSRLPPEIQHDVQIIDDSFPLDKWEFNTTKNNVINLYAFNIHNESDIEGFQGKRIGNYTMYIIHDREFETTQSEVAAYLDELMKNPDYQIAHVGIGIDKTVDPTELFVDLWCYRSTPENKKLDKTMIKGYKIIVIPLPPLPLEPTLNTSSSNTSS